MAAALELGLATVALLGASWGSLWGFFGVLELSQPHPQESRVTVVPQRGGALWVVK